SLVDSYKTTWHLGVNRTGHFDGIRTRVQHKKVRKQIWIHRLITNCPENMIVDHKNGDVLNNTRDNLRVVDSFINAQNIKIDKNTKSGIRNISVTNTGRFLVSVKNKKFGSYKTLEEAVKVADIKRQEIF